MSSIGLPGELSGKDFNEIPAFNAQKVVNDYSYKINTINKNEQLSKKEKVKQVCDEVGKEILYLRMHKVGLDSIKPLVLKQLDDLHLEKAVVTKIMKTILKDPAQKPKQSSSEKSAITQLSETLEKFDDIHTQLKEENRELKIQKMVLIEETIDLVKELGTENSPAGYKIDDLKKELTVLEKSASKKGASFKEPDLKRTELSKETQLSEEVDELGARNHALRRQNRALRNDNKVLVKFLKSHSREEL
ncbi:MAG: hypothetical protein JWO53_404 [Chlamydiia bacterium]|nr:hypothetical protein [Chlamydiia bacterium]